MSRLVHPDGSLGSRVVSSNSVDDVSLEASLPFIAVDSDSSVLPEHPLHSLVPLASASDAVDSIRRIVYVVML